MSSDDGDLVNVKMEGWKHKDGSDDENGSPRTVADLPVEPMVSPLLLPGAAELTAPPLLTAPPPQLPSGEPSAYTLKAARMCPRPPAPSGSVFLVIFVLMSAIALIPERQPLLAPSPPASRRCLSPLVCWMVPSMAPSKPLPGTKERPAPQRACLDPIDGTCWAPSWAPWRRIGLGLGLGLTAPIAVPASMPRPKDATSPPDMHCDGWDASIACRSGWPMPYEAHLHLLNPALLLVLHA